MSIYLDTSFVVSLYSADTNSSVAAGTMLTSRSPALISAFTELEVINALQLRLFRKQDSATEVRMATDLFDEDLRVGRFQRRNLPEFVFQRARQLSLATTAKLGTRTSDLLHVAAALELGAKKFYSFDMQQRTLCKAVKLKVNPY